MSHIIQQNNEQQNKEAWIYDLANVVTDLKELFSLLALDELTLSPAMLAAKKQFALRVPLSFIARMEKGNPDDPLLRQILCDQQEMQTVLGYSSDPLNEQHNAIPGLLHKYHNRALLITKTNCAINCRYCFRRHFPYQDNQGSKANLTQALAYIADHTELNEIILSGGDPLMAKDHELQWLIEQLAAIAHVERLRIHTRLAIVMPNRITDNLCQLLHTSRLDVVLVTHINHPNEIDQSVIDAMSKLKQHQVTLLNQSVLLKDINDHVETLVALSNQLFNAGILPYYLHVLDKVQGAAHFLVDDQRAQELMRGLAAQVSGYLVPKLTREVGGEKNKRVLPY
ncbi:L-lysine 2,3-aminomutase [Orbus hercynius]|uniref:L-lysine 2,3-aminomutase n=1 Tax=Orbus hercynius TaxID=593135 RepID=A0A495REN9_9GAMM|nr:L-lysine 2,3-aminomutase [Orbus hercynius]